MFKQKTEINEDITIHPMDGVYIADDQRNWIYRTKVLSWWKHLGGRIHKYLIAWATLVYT